MKNRPHIVRPGEHLGAIAYRAGVPEDEIWNAPENARLKEARPGGHMLVAGDLLHVKETPPPSPISLRVGGDTTVVATIPKVKVRAVLVKQGKPLAGEPWHLEARGEKASGVTKADGAIELEVRVTTRDATIVLEKTGGRRTLSVGGLDPADTPSGCAHRLANLGLYRGKATTRFTDALRDALKKFQRAQKLTETGELDEVTRDALVKAHGS